LKLRGYLLPLNRIELFDIFDLMRFHSALVGHVLSKLWIRIVQRVLDLA